MSMPHVSIVIQFSPVTTETPIHDSLSIYRKKKKKDSKLEINTNEYQT